ncbi:MAG: hypothetical protein ACR2MS_02210 [Weeksellaceae bacterium]
MAENKTKQLGLLMDQLETLVEYSKLEYKEQQTIMDVIQKMSEIVKRLNGERSEPVAVRVVIPVRYPEDNELNGKSDENGDLPFLDGEIWSIDIDLDTGKIKDWPSGNTVVIHDKVNDMGSYYLLDSHNDVIFSVDEDSYVPDFLQINDYGFGDYVLFSVEEDGKIYRWPGKDKVMEWFTEYKEESDD